MLRFHSTVAKGEIKVDPEASSLPPGVNWIDALRPDKPEVDQLRRLLGIVPPTLDELSEIETSSRLYRDKDHLFMSMPMVVRSATGAAQTSPLGFVMTKDYVLTIRYKQIKACEDLHYVDVVENGRGANGPGGFITLLEAIIDRAADELEKITAELESVSESIFGATDALAARGPDRESHDLRKALTRIGRLGNLASKLGEVLLGASRILPFVTTEAAAYLTAEERAKIKGLGRDISSLNEYETRQTDKIQFLLDATLGFSNIEQNNIFRLLTIVSVVGIPPTLFAGIYGMNFKNMPELDWPYGYAFGLAVIVISGLIPMLWFKRRGWW